MVFLENTLENGASKWKPTPAILEVKKWKNFQNLASFCILLTL